MACELEIDKDLFNYIHKFETQELDFLKFKYPSIDFAFPAIPEDNLSTSSSFLEHNKVKISINPADSKALRELSELVDRVRAECAFVGVPLPICLTGFPASDKLLRVINSQIVRVQKCTPYLAAVKILITSLGPTHAGIDVDESLLWKSPECLRFICEKKSETVALDAMHMTLRYLALQLVARGHQIVQKFFEPLSNVAQFRFRTGKAKPGRDLSSCPVLKVYTADLMRLPLDAIVCASDPMFSFNGGAASAVAQRAGPELRAAREKFLVSNPAGLPPNTIGITGGFMLPARFVLFTAIPHNLTEKQFKKALMEMFKQVIEECNNRKYLRVGLPLIGAGQLGVFKGSCAEMLYQALKLFPQSNSNVNVIREIHLVNIDVKCTETIIAEFKSHKKSLERIEDCQIWLTRDAAGPSPLHPNWSPKSDEPEPSTATVVSESSIASSLIGDDSNRPTACINKHDATPTPQNPSTRGDQAAGAQDLSSTPRTQTETSHIEQVEPICEAATTYFDKTLLISRPETEFDQIANDYAIARALDDALNSESAASESLFEYSSRSDPERLDSNPSSGYLSSTLASGPPSNASANS